MTLNTDTIPRRLDRVRMRIRAAELRHGRNPGSVQLLAVSKTKPARALEAAYAAGQRSFGESYVQEAVEKITALADLGIAWHFIGPIQSNKTRVIAEHFHWVHSVDRLKVACRLSEQRPESLGPLDICLQVNVSGESSKSGLEPEEVREVAEAVAVLPRLRLRGLMTIPAPADDFETQRKPFRVLRRLYDDLERAGLAVDTLSMGMSDDLEAAVAEGTTIVRIGSAIFGARS